MVGEPFAQVPEALLDAEISDRAIRLYALLDRYAGVDGKAYPRRSTLADRMRCSLKSVDRAADELVGAGHLAIVSGRHAGTANHYRLSRGCATGDLPPASPVSQGCVTGDAQKESQEREPEKQQAAGCVTGDLPPDVAAEAERRIARRRAAGETIGKKLEELITNDIIRERTALKPRPVCSHCNGRRFIDVDDNGVAVECVHCARGAGVAIADQTSDDGVRALSGFTHGSDFSGSSVPSREW